MQIRSIRKLSGGVVLCLCLALSYVSLKVSSLSLESVMNLESLESVKSLENLKSLDSLDSLESHEGLDSLSTWKAEDLPSVLRVDQWPQGIRFAQWNHTGETGKKQYPGDWVDLLKELVPGNCNIVDIGAHGGDTTLPLAIVARGGTVVAFEMGVPFKMLEINRRLNPQLKIDNYNLAVSDSAGKVWYDSSSCAGCNGGIVEEDTGQKVDSVRLVTFLLQQYSREFVSSICLVKIDAEGYDNFILGDFPDWFRPRVVWTEWFLEGQEEEENMDDGCFEVSRSLFNTSRKLGYTVYQTRLPLVPSPGCSSFQPDLLLMSKDAAASVLQDKTLELEWRLNF